MITAAAAAAAATAAAANTVRSTKLVAILKQKDDFPEHQQNKINDLVGEFLQKLRNDVHKTITAQDADTYTGLDSKRDTKQQVRTMLQFFPETMEQKKVMKWDSDLGIWNHARGDGDYPINCLAYMFSTRKKRGICNVMAAPFIHIFAQVAIDCGLFKNNNNNNNNNNNVDGTVVSTTTKQGEEQEQQSQRGGLVIDNETWENTLQCLVCCSDPPRVVEDDNNNNTNINANNDDEEHEQHQQLVDTVFLSELVQLRRMNLFKKEDILKYNLMYGLYSNVYFSKKRFEFLAEFDPVCLLPQQQIRNNNSDDDDANPNDVTEDCTLLHFAAIDTSIEPFRCVLDYTIRYYPLWKGITLLFKQETSREEDDDGDDDDDDNDNAVDSDTMHSDIDGLNNIVGNRVRGVDLLLHRHELFAAFLNNYYGDLGRIILDNGDDNNDNDDDNGDNNGNALNDDNNNDGEGDDDSSSSSSVIEEDTDDDTPFQIACNEHGREEVMDVVNTVLATYSSTTGGTTTAATTTATQLRTVEALIVACTDETIHLDCVFFLLRREPHILNGVVVPTPSVSKDNDDDGTDDDNNTGRADDDDWTLVKKNIN